MNGIQRGIRETQIRLVDGTAKHKRRAVQQVGLGCLKAKQNTAHEVPRHTQKAWPGGASPAALLGTRLSAEILRESADWNYL